MSQVYQSEKDRVEGKELDPRVSKSCILDGYLWTRIGRAWKSQNSFFFLNRPMFEKESIMWSVTFSCVCLLFQIVICASYDITLLQIVCHSHSIIVEMLLSWEDLWNTIIA